MKSKLFFVLVLSMAAGLASAQNLKIAYADVEYIFSKMPESKQIESSLQAHQTQLENQLKAKYDEYQQKLTALQNLPATTPDAVQRDRMNELAQLEQNIQTFQQDAQKSMESKRGELLDPVYTKVGNSINSVAEENGFDFVFTAGVGGTDIVLYANEQYDISDLVLKKMGVAVN